jgi:hypothetical protein
MKTNGDLAKPLNCSHFRQRKDFRQLTGCRMFPPVSWQPMQAFWNSAAPWDWANAVQKLSKQMNAKCSINMQFS